MSVALKKVDGIASVDVSLEKATADIRLEPGNTVALPRLRQIIRESGYPTKDAHISARGILTERNGKPVLDLQNGSFIELAARPDASMTGASDITGVSRVVDKREVLTITPGK